VIGTGGARNAPESTTDIMKAGICSYAFRYAAEAGKLTPLGLVEIAAGLGAEAVQICDNLPLAGLSNGELDLLATRAAELGIALEVGIAELTRENLLIHLPLAARLGSPVLRALVESSAGRPHPDQVVQTIRDLSGAVADSGVILALENHFLLTPKELLEIVTRLDVEHVRVCLDPLNSLRLLAGPGEVVHQLADLSVTAHIKDVILEPDQTGFNIRGCPLGEGLLDAPEMIRALRERGQVANIHVEAWMDPAGTLEETLQQEERWNRQAVTTLKGLLG
jgi:3-oxoisoapionate decarboxylase